MEARPRIPVELSTTQQEDFIKALGALPKNGIAYRGDSILKEQIYL